VIASVYHPHLIRRPCPSRPGASRSTDPSSWRLAYQPPGWCGRRPHQPTSRENGAPAFNGFRALPCRHLCRTHSRGPGKKRQRIHVDCLSV